MSTCVKTTRRLTAFDPSGTQLGPSGWLLAPMQRVLLAGSLMCAAGLLASLALVCQESVQRGERFRATQNTQAPSVVALAPGRFQR